VICSWFAWHTWLRAALVVLTGCGALQSSGMPRAGAYVSDARSSSTCRGSHGVSADPCPVRLTTASGVEVTISGPGVTDSLVYPCQPSLDICMVSQIDGTHWQVTPGASCGRDHLPAHAYNEKGRLVGDTRLHVINQYCPSV
jgi:hypothetical protein